MMMQSRRDGKGRPADASERDPSVTRYSPRVPAPLDRPLAHRRVRGPVREAALRALALALALALLAALASHIDFRHDLHRMRVRVLSGPEGGNYRAIALDLGARAAKRHGVVEAITTAGATENAERLSAAAHDCDVEFALTQNGLDLGANVSLVGRLPRSESMLFLGKDADDIHDFADLKGRRIGVGPAGSGADRVARELFALPDFAPLGLVLSNRPSTEQLALAASGDLDLALVVTNSEAPLVVEWVGRRGLQIASFTHIDALARRLPHLQAGQIAAGLYDAVRGVPKTDKRVIKIETLVVSNGCAGRVATMDLVSVLAAEFPDFVRHNKDTENTSGLPLVPAAADFYANGGLQLADEYFPWLVDVMPPANWAYVVMALSLLFNAMGAGHRFRLWRIDAVRVKLEQEASALFPPHATLGDIQRTSPDASLLRPEGRAALARVIDELTELAERSRRYSLSVLVPMGQEMAYRYQEGVIHETLAVFRDVQRRCADATKS